MRKRSNGSSAPPSVGGASLLVAFSVLCLTVFALLCLSTVHADDRISQVSAEAVEAYYQADCEAQEILSRLRAGERPDTVASEGDIYSYTCPISETQALEVAVLFRDGEYTILRWQAVSTADWDADEDMHFWDGNL